MFNYELPYIEPQKIFEVVAESYGTIWLSSGMLHNHYGRYSFIVINPLKIYTGEQISVAIAMWDELFKHNVQRCDSSNHESDNYDREDNYEFNNPELPPFTGGLVGYFSYDLNKELEPNLYATSSPHNVIDIVDIPNYQLGLYNQVIAFDHYKQKCYLMVAEVDDYNLNYATQLQELLQIYNTANISTHIHTNINNDNNNNDTHTYVDDTLPKLTLTSNFTQTQYINVVEQAIDYIKNGDIFEINLAQRYIAQINNYTHDYPCAALFSKLSQINPAPFAAYLNFGDLVILSASPERFLSVKNREIEARPIKGTIRRHGLNQKDYRDDCNQNEDNKNKDNILKEQLLNSTKDRAENIMIVDLMRNDLSKICTPSSIYVSQLCEVESFTNVHHLVSVINGVLKPDISIFDIIPAAFPGGSITGAPKIRAMQIIGELEGVPRGVYCGSVGYFGFNGNVDLSIAIRTIVKNKNELSFSVGGAVTLASNPQAEYEESLLKGQKLMEAIIGEGN
jgi:para-aminobenzoate synthetase component 1